MYWIILAKQEISSLEEKVAVLQRDLSSYENQLEQLRREGSSKAEAGRASEGALHTQIVKLKEELHSSRFVGHIRFIFSFPRYIFSWIYWDDDGNHVFILFYKELHHICSVHR